MDRSQKLDGVRVADFGFQRAVRARGWAVRGALVGRFIWWVGESPTTTAWETPKFANRGNTLSTKSLVEFAADCAENGMHRGTLSVAPSARRCDFWDARCPMK
jgi:hypothetical protein